MSFPLIMLILFHRLQKKKKKKKKRKKIEKSANLFKCDQQQHRFQVYFYIKNKNLGRNSSGVNFIQKIYPNWRNKVIHRNKSRNICIQKFYPKNVLSKMYMTYSSSLYIKWNLYFCKQCLNFKKSVVQN